MLCNFFFWYIWTLHLNERFAGCGVGDVRPLRHTIAHTHTCRSAVVVQRLEADVADVRGAHLRCGYRREALTSSQHALGLPGERWFKRSNSKTHTYTTTHINVSEGRCSHNWSRPHQTRMTQLENARIHERAPYNFLSQMYIFLDALDSLLWFRTFRFKPLKSPQNILKKPFIKSLSCDSAVEHILSRDKPYVFKKACMSYFIAN